MHSLRPIKTIIRFFKKLQRYSGKSYTPRYRVVNVYKDENDKFVVTIQIIGKGIVYHHRPDEVLADDNFVDFLSPRDVRTLTYLGYLEINQPEYKLLAKRLSENNKEVFVIKKRGEKKIFTKTAEEINSSEDIIKKMASEDANKIGYAVASMEALEEKIQKDEALKELHFQNTIAEKVIKIGTPADYPPFCYMNEDNDYTGFDIDIINEIFSDLNIKFEIIKTSWLNMNNDLLSKKFDMAIGGISLSEDREIFLFSSPIMKDGKTLLTSKKYEYKIKSLEDVDKNIFTIVENRGGTNEKFVMEKIKNAKIVILENNLEIFDGLANGEFDFMFTDLSEALYRESLDNRLSVVKPISIYTKPLGYGFIYNEQNISLRDYIDRLLEKLTSSERFNEISSKYFNIGLNNAK